MCPLFVVFSSLWDVQGKSLDMLLFNVPSMQEPNLWQKSLCTTLLCTSGSMTSDRRNSTRKYGYSIRGIRPVDHRILIRGARYTTIPVMSIDGIVDVYITEGTTTGEKFEFFIRNYLLTILQPFNGVNSKSVVIMDNASIHHVDFNVYLIESTGAKLLFLPPYSPDLNPLEPVFGKVKAILKDNDILFQTTSCPRVFLEMAFSLISQEDCNNFSRHCGYTM